MCVERASKKKFSFCDGTIFFVIYEQRTYFGLGFSLAATINESVEYGVNFDIVVHAVF